MCSLESQFSLPHPAWSVSHFSHPRRHGEETCRQKWDYRTSQLLCLPWAALPMVPPFSQHLEPQLRIPPLWLSSFQASQFKRPSMERSLASLGTAWSCQVSVLAPVPWGLEEVAEDLGSGHTIQCMVPRPLLQAALVGQQSPSEGAHLSSHLLHRPLEENVLESWVPH